MTSQQRHSRKVLPCPDKVLELCHGLLGVLSTTSIHVSVKDTSDLSNRFVVRTHGYPSTRSKIRAYARGLKPEETHRSRDWPTWVSCYKISTVSTPYRLDVRCQREY
jgi:hypothetical protein